MKALDVAPLWLMMEKFHPDRRLVAGWLALAAIALLLGGAFAGLLWEAGRDWAGAAGAFDVYLLRIIRFTLWQALLSTALSILPAILVARALYRQRDFPGRALLIRLFGVPLALPAIVAAMGVLALYGRNGIFADLFGTLTGGRWPGIYGLSGILVAHAFFNLPLATRLLLEALEATPADQSRLAAQLGMGPGSAFRHLEWPPLRAALPGVAALVFMLCVTSFTIVLTLGGGPRATTLEVAIYQSLRFDFDPAAAVALTLVQVALTSALVLAALKLGADLAADGSLPVASRRHIRPSGRETTLNALLLAAAALFVLSPMAAVVVSGLHADLSRLAGEASVHSATATSLVLATLAAGLAVSLSLALVAAKTRAARGPRAWLFGAAPSLVLVVPPIVVGAGWFVLLRHGGQPLAAAPVMVVTVNAMMAMPFVMRTIGPAYDESAARHDRLAASLGINGLARLRLVDWPALRRPLLTGFAFAMALSLGDLGVIALFGSDSVQTLPYLLLSRMGAYRTADAAGLALILGVLCLILIWTADRLARRPA